MNQSVRIVLFEVILEVVGGVALQVPELQSAEGHFGEDVFNFLELLFKGAFSSCERVEEVFGDALTFEVFSVVILFDVLDFPDFIIIEVLDKEFFLSIGNAFQMVKGPIVSVATLNLNSIAFYFLGSFILQIIGDHDLFDRNVMMLRALELTMKVILTIFALVNFVRSHNVLIFVLHKKEKLVVHVTNFQAFHQVFISQIVKNAVVQRLYVVGKNFPLYKTQRQYFWPFIFPNCKLLHHRPIQRRFGALLAGKSQTSFLEDAKIRYFSLFLQNFLGMCDFSDHAFSQIHDGFVIERVKEAHVEQ